MRRFKTIAAMTALLALGVMGSACASQYQRSVVGDNWENHLEEWHKEQPFRIVKSHFIFWGLGQTDVIDAAAVCDGADRVVAVEAYKSLSDTSATLSTLGIYSPRSANIYCRR